MTTAAENLEKYLAGQPLTPELARIRAGQFDDPVPTMAAEILAGFNQPAHDDDRPTSKEERQALREGRQVGAVTTLIRLMRKRLRGRIRRATIDSEKDPLARSQEIAQTWAYIAVYRQVSLEIETMITEEIEQLEKEERGQ